MKMNKFKYIVLSGVAILLTTFATTSCDDANDWTTDSAFDRLFGVTKMGITAYATEAEFTWTSVPNTEYYIIEVSKDTLYDAIGMGANGAIVYGLDKTVTKSPFTLTGLDSSSKYFLRMKSMSSEKESKWSYPTEFSFKTKSEQIMENVGLADKTATTVVLRWTPDATVTHIDLLKGSDKVKTIDLTNTAKEEGTITIDGLEALTTYTANLYNNDVKRGFVTFQTYPSVPEADKTVYMEANDSLNQTLFDELAAGEYKNVTIALPGDAIYNNKNKLTIPDGMSVTFFGLPGVKQPVIAVQAFDLSSKHGFIKFDNVELSAYCIDGDKKTTQNSYIFNQSTETNVGTIEFNNCFIREFLNTPIRLQGSATKTINELIINNSIIYGPSTRSYSIIHVDASSGAGKIENITVTNSTIWKSGKSLIYCKSTNFTKVTLQNNTFSKVPGEGDYLIDCGDANFGPSAGIVLENNLFGSIAGSAAKGIRAKGTVTATNNYTTSDWKTSGNHIKDLIPYEGTEEALLTNPKEGDFTIKDNSFEGKKSCGDPRWYIKD